MLRAALAVLTTTVIAGCVTTQSSAREQSQIISKTAKPAVEQLREAQSRSRERAPPARAAEPPPEADPAAAPESPPDAPPPEAQPEPPPPPTAKARPAPPPQRYRY
jgi:outer membrane murein-binding lipoprotein Lpp